MATSVVNPRVQFFANNGRPLIGGRIHTYVAGSSTRATTYKDAAKAQPNTNPIVLDGRGEAQIYLAEGVEYKFVIEDSKGALIYTQEPVYGAIWPNAADWPSDATLSYQYMSEAKAAVDSMGVTRAPFDTYAQALAALSGLAEGDRIEVSIDETRDDARTRYKVEDGGLVFVVNLDQLRLDLKTASGQQMIGLANTTAAEEFQAALGLSGVHKLTLNPGQYDFGGQTFTIFNKNHNTRRGEYIVDLTGVEFQGSGTIIIDSCKRVKIKGLFAPNWDIDLRGVWWSDFENCMYRRTYTGRAGTIFSDSYWNQWIGGVTQAVIVPSDAVGPSNAYMWHNHSMRGNAQQGFSGTETHAFHFLGNQNAQQWIFSGDISYHTVDVINAPDTNTADIELDFNVYWDSVVPVLNSRPNVRLRNRGHHANGTGTFLPWQQALKTHVDVTRRDRILLNTPGSVRNMVLNGDFSEQMASWAGANQPFQTVSGATVTWAEGGLSGGYLQVSQAATSNNAISAVGRNKQFAGTYTAVWVVRNRDAGERTIRASIGAPVGLNFVTAKINDTEPTVITLSASNVPAGAGSIVSSLFADAAGFNVDILYVGICPGIHVPMLLPQVRRREIRADLVSAGVIVPANQYFIEVFTVQGAAVGDKVDVSVGSGSLWSEGRITSANTVQVKYLSTGGISIDTTGLNVYITVRKRLLGA